MKIINFLKNVYNWCQSHDKSAHFIIGIFLGLLYLVAAIFFAPELAVGISLLFSSVVFIGKEVYDKYKPNPTGFDFNDLFVDYLGWFIGTFIAGVIHIIILLIIL